MRWLRTRGLNDASSHHSRTANLMVLNEAGIGPCPTAGESRRPEAYATELCKGLIVPILDFSIAAQAMFMRFSSVAVLALLLSIPGLSGCDSDGVDGFSITSYVGTYEGTITTTIREPERTSTVETARTSVTIQAASQTGPVTVIIDSEPAYPGAPDPPARTLAGNADESGANIQMFGTDETASFRIHQSGQISGSGVWLRQGNRIEMVSTGRLTERSFNFVIDGAVAQPGGELPIGSTVRIDFATTR